MAPTLLAASSADIGGPTRTWLRAHADTLGDGHIAGGTGAISATASDDATAAGRPTTTTTAVSLLPSGNVTGPTGQEPPGDTVPYSVA